MDLKDQLAAVAEKLFPGSSVPDVVDSFLQYRPTTLVDCARQTPDQPERQKLYIAAANIVSAIKGENKTFNTEKIGRPDQDNPCNAFVYGITPHGACQTDGHWQCGMCSERDPDTIRDPDLPWYIPPMNRRRNKSEW